MLSFQVLGWATEPIFACLRVVAVSNGGAGMVDSGRLGVVGARGIGGLSNGDINIEVAGFVACAHDDAVDITCSASVHFVLLGGVASVARQVLLLV